MRRNLTIVADDTVIAWARVEAAKRGISTSAFVGDLVRARMVEAEGERTEGPRDALEALFAIPPLNVIGPNGRPPSREEIYAERIDPMLRRHERADLHLGAADREQESYRADMGDGPASAAAAGDKSSGRQ